MDNFLPSATMAVDELLLMVLEMSRPVRSLERGIHEEGE